MAYSMNWVGSMLKSPRHYPRVRTQTNLFVQRHELLIARFPPVRVVEVDAEDCQASRKGNPRIR